MTVPDVLPEVGAEQLLRPVCSSDAWVAGVLAGRPYPDVDAIDARSDDLVAALDWPDVLQALDAHPRIGQRAGGADREAAWSREEQAGAATAGEDATEALRRGNADYERRFGHVFLICATGRSAEQVLGALHERLDNPPSTERDVVRRELAAIARVRLAKAFR